MNQQLNIKIPDWFELNDLEVLNVTVQDANQNSAIIIVGENLDSSKFCRPTIRLYLAEQQHESLEVTKELNAFLFDTNEDAIRFSESLPQISALQLAVVLSENGGKYTY